MRKSKSKHASRESAGGVATVAAPPALRPAPAAAAAVAPSVQLKPLPPAKPTSMYFVNAYVDFAVIGGLSIVTYLVLRFGVDNQRYATGITIAAMFAWVCNWPHFSATSYRLYHSMDNIMQYPLTALVVPWFIVAAMIGAILSPGLIAPYLVKLFFWWSSYHFCGQTFGITMIYARRAGFPIGRWERFGLTTFIYSSFLVLTSTTEVSVGPFDFYGIKYYGLGLPAWLPTVFHVIMWAGGILFLFLAVQWMRKNRRILPLIVLVPAAAQYVWFVVGASWLAFNEFVPFFHCMQYLLIAWSMQLKEKMDLKQIEPSARYVIGESLRWGIFNILGGAALFFFFPISIWAIVNRVSVGEIFHAMRDLLMHQGAPTVQGLPFFIGVTIIGVQIHHFFVDGVIWKLKRKSVASPLMVNLSDMLEPAHAG